MKKLYFIVFLFILSILSGCSSDNELQGSWLSPDGDILNFISNDSVRISQYGQYNNKVYEYSINGDTLILKDSEGGLIL